ncbi:hypothetical protein [Solwaraspora sp. WMMD792]|uniref:hypothetical protein n=1 Tax=Solwaraspora sp. WMMD792 TaxID=3016099 RepID=UPI002416B787|nr:hypothetical protein [Solwaraspora sp. WMMD792]MDG4774773.1 hypothetical protein [Solwaraspora sp. WMMD792]
MMDVDRSVNLGAARESMRQPTTYRELEAAGLVTSRRGGGTRVAAAPPAGPGPDEMLRHQAAAFVRETRQLGVDDSQIISAVARALAASMQDPDAQVR